MKNLRVLVVYFSRTGNTRRVAREIATSLSGEIEEIVEDRGRTGVIAYLRSGFEAWFGRPVRLRESRCDPSDFDLVVIGTPIWNHSVSSPVRAYLEEHRHHLPGVAFFVTCGGSGMERVTRQLAQLSRRAPRAVLVLRERELDETPARVAAFAAHLLSAMPTRSAA